jgi:hypothetical protein
MLSESEKQTEIQQWGIIYQIALKRKSLSELEFSPEERVVLRVLEKIERQISSIKKQ